MNAMSKSKKTPIPAFSPKPPPRSLWPTGILLVWIIASFPLLRGEFISIDAALSSWKKSALEKKLETDRLIYVLAYAAQELTSSQARILFLNSHGPGSYDYYLWKLHYYLWPRPIKVIAAEEALKTEAWHGENYILILSETRGNPSVETVLNQIPSLKKIFEQRNNTYCAIYLNTGESAPE